MYVHKGKLMVNINFEWPYVLNFINVFTAESFIVAKHRRALF